MTMQHELYTELVNNMQEQNPAWARRDTDPIDGALQGISTVLTKSHAYFNTRERAAFLATATGADLDEHGRALLVYRRAGETDTVFRSRIIATRNRTRPLGSLSSMEAQAVLAAPNLSQVIAQPNYTTGLVTLYLLRRDNSRPPLPPPGQPYLPITGDLPGTPTAQDISTVTTAFSGTAGKTRILASQQVAVSPTTTITEYYLRGSIAYDVNANATYVTEATEAIYSWIDDNRAMGHPIRKALLIGAIARIVGTVSIDITLNSGASLDVDVLNAEQTGETDAQRLLRERTAYSCRKLFTRTTDTSGQSIVFVQNI